jgi:hypothetical protein
MQKTLHVYIHYFRNILHDLYSIITFITQKLPVEF